MGVRGAKRSLAGAAVIVLSVLAAMVVGGQVRASAAQPWQLAGLNVFVAYADNQQGEPLAPSWFPNPWQGSPNIKFLGSPDPRAASCGGGVNQHLCYSAGAIRLDNPGTSDVTITSLVVDAHSSVTGGKKFSNLWSDAVSPAHTFIVPHGQSVILTEDQPPGQNLTYDNFDTSDLPDRGCSPIQPPPTLTFTIQGDPTPHTLTDTNHVIDTGEIINTVFGSVDAGWCPSDANSPRNESIQWQEVGARLPAPQRSTCTNEEALRPRPCKSASLMLSPPPSNPPPGTSVPETATLLGPDGLGLANASVTFGVLAGPSASQQPVSMTTDGNGQATFTFTEANNSSNGDLVAATSGVTGSFQSDPVCVAWGAGSCPPPPPPPPPPGCPASWSCADIGNPAPAGSQTYDSGTGTWTLQAGGSDIFGAADHFHYDWQSVSGDGGISARIASQTNTYTMAKAGVMLRADNSPGSPEFSALVAPSNLVFMEYRTTAGGTTTRAGTVSGSLPKYLQVSRTGSSFTASWSDNGSTWTPLGSPINIPAMSGTILQGLAATSHNTSALSTVTYDSVVLGGGPPPPPPPNDFSISASPSTVMVMPGNSGTTTISTAVTSGSAQTVALSASGLPSGATAGFSPSSVTAGGSSTMTIMTTTSTSTGNYTVTVTGTGAPATHSTSVTLVVQTSSPPPTGCPALWTCADIGSPTPPGSESVSSGTWMISAGGSDIFGSADHFRYDYQSPGGTTNTVEAQITGQSNSNAWAKAGVMMRADNTAGSPQFSVLITPGNGIFVEYRSTAGGTTARVGTVAGQVPPKYIWVVRSGTTFTGYYNTTNSMVTWTMLFSQTIPAMSGTVLEGLAAASHSSALCTVTMDTVTVS
jgi:hypothetical protein